MPLGERSVSEVLQDIVRNIQDIVRSEVRLAKTEVREEVAKAKAASLMMGLGALSGVFSAFFLLFALVQALSRVLPDWAAALIVAVALALAAAVLFKVGIDRFSRIHPIPDQTMGTLKENVEWAKQQTK